MLSKEKLSPDAQAYLARLNKHVTLVKKLGSDVFGDSYTNHDIDKLNASQEVFELWAERFAKGMGGLDDEAKAKVNLLLGQHVKTQPHHVEYWDSGIKAKDWDEEKAVAGQMPKKTDGRQMSNRYLREMCCDWTAVSIEKNSDPHKWLEKVSKERYDFTPEQIRYMNRCLDKLDKVRKGYSINEEGEGAAPADVAGMTTSDDFDTQPKMFDKKVITRDFGTLFPPKKKVLMPKKSKKTKGLFEDELKGLVSSLQEGLDDMPNEPKNYHYTNIKALMEMYETGGLKSQIYVTRSDKAYNNKASYEIATVRDAGKHAAENPERAWQLSEKIDNVKISLFTDKILAGLRGIRKGPVAEFPINDQKSWEDTLENLKDYNKSYDEPFPFLKDYKNNMSIEELKKWIKDHWKYKGHTDLSDKDWHDLAWEIRRKMLHLKGMRGKLIHREHEERFLSKKEFRIPLDPRFMKIEFIDEPKEQYLEQMFRVEEPFFLNHTVDLKKAIGLCDKYCGKIDETIKTLNHMVDIGLIDTSKTAKYYRNTLATIKGFKTRLKMEKENLEKKLEQVTAMEKHKGRIQNWDDIMGDRGTFARTHLINNLVYNSPQEKRKREKEEKNEAFMRQNKFDIGKMLSYQFGAREESPND